MTMSAWVNPTTTSQIGGIISNDSSLTKGYEMFAHNSGNLYCDIATGRVGIAYSANTWSYYACTYDGTTLKMYRNGSLVASTALSGSIVVPGTDTLIGDMTSGHYFSGSIDDVRIYNRALTSYEIYDQYLTGR